jgi:hypothetical protein
MERQHTSAARIYSIAAPLCVVAPVFVPPWLFDKTVALTYVAFGGLPMCGLAVLLATIHWQHQLEGWTYRAIAWIWTAAALLAFVPVGAWVDSRLWGNTSLGLRALMMVSAALLLMLLAIRVWRLATNVRTVLAAGIAFVACPVRGIQPPSAPRIAPRRAHGARGGGTGSRGVFRQRFRRLSGATVSGHPSLAPEGTAAAHPAVAIAPRLQPGRMSALRGGNRASLA